MKKKIELKLKELRQKQKEVIQIQTELTELQTTRIQNEIREKRIKGTDKNGL